MAKIKFGDIQIRYDTFFTCHRKCVNLFQDGNALYCCLEKKRRPLIVDCGSNKIIVKRTQACITAQVDIKIIREL